MQDAVCLIRIISTWGRCYRLDLVFGPNPHGPHGGTVHDGVRIGWLVVPGRRSGLGGGVLGLDGDGLGVGAVLA